MMDIETAQNLPIASLKNATKSILFELRTGERFYLLGGRDSRGTREGVACFTPNEILSLLKVGIMEDEFKQLIDIKKVFGDTIVKCYIDRAQEVADIQSLNREKGATQTG